MTRLRRVGGVVVDAVFPRRCAGCGRRGIWLCERCHETISPIHQTGCPRCGVPLLAGRCSCRDLHPAIERAVSPFPYVGWVAEAIKYLKYENESARAEHLGAALADAVRLLGPIDGLVPVPLHTRKHRARGYNQSELLARSVSVELGIPLIPMIQRTRPTTAQMTLGADERRRNVAHAFAWIGEACPLPAGRYVLIDDVRTTGSTLSACAEAMVAGGVGHVLVATLAVDLDRAQLDVLRRRGLLRDGDAARS